MRKYLTLITGGAVCASLFVGCHDDGSAAPLRPPPAPSGTAFETYAIDLINGSTCDSLLPVETNNVEFYFNADQDAAIPRDVSLVDPTCTSS